jgi:hypothetical protein
MHKMSEGVYKKNFKFEEEHTVISLLPKSMNSRLIKMLEKASKAKEEGSSSDRKYMLKKVLQDSDNLEKFYSDKEYRRRLVSSSSAEANNLGVIRNLKILPLHMILQ